MSYVFSVTSNKRCSIQNNTIQMEKQNFQACNKRIYLDAKNVGTKMLKKSFETAVKNLKYHSAYQFITVVKTFTKPFL